MVCLFPGTLKVTEGHRWSEPEWRLCRKNSSNDISESEVCDTDVGACSSGMYGFFVKYEFLAQIFQPSLQPILSASQLNMLMYSIFIDWCNTWILEASPGANWLRNSVQVCDCPMLCLLPSSLSGKYSNGWYGNLWMSSDLKCKAGSPGDELAPCCTLSTTQPDIRIPCAGRNPRIWSRCGNRTRSDGTSGPAPNSSQPEGKSKWDGTGYYVC